MLPWLRRSIALRRGYLTLPSRTEGRVIDLRSDTVTQPTPLMREAMSKAKVGDDVYKEDPTVIELEKQTAALLGKEAGLFVPSGTMGNLIAVMVHCNRRGMEVLLGDECHINLFEQGNVAQFGGVFPRALRTNPDGTFDLGELVNKVRRRDYHEPWTGLICIENPHNWCGGRVLPLKFIDQLGELKQSLKLPVHLDGARILNAALYLKVPATRLTASSDSVCICLSKGLAAPVGSVLVGSTNFINVASRVRKALGGGMRQAGVIAAAGIVSLDTMVDRLEQDHHHARLVAEAIVSTGTDVVLVNVEHTHTNVVLLKITPGRGNAARLCKRLLSISEKEKAELKESIHIKASLMGSYQIRMLFHKDVSFDDVEAVIRKLRFVFDELATSSS